MTEQNDKEVQELLKHAFTAVDTELQRDLWPAMLRRLDAARPALPWYDWLLIGGSMAVMVFSPRLVLLFAYHF